MNNRKIIIAVLIVLFLFVILILYLISPPKDFPTEHFTSIDEGKGLFEIAVQLEKENVIKSDIVFVFLAKIIGKETGIKSGDYWLQEPVSIFGIIKRLITADFGLTPFRITVPEGLTLKDIAEIFEDFENFNKEKFLLLTQGPASASAEDRPSLEGYLFPDTYFFLPNVTAEEIIKTMRENFDKKVGEIEFDVLIMASLIEKELADYDDRRIVSGILWKRLEVGMPLQVDAIFPYIIGKSSLELTLKDLKIDSPYNTYLYKGLPPAPICNPGLDAIDAALNPQDSDYWYYLSDKEGIIHFAKNFEEHKLNKAKYLK